MFGSITGFLFITKHNKHAIALKLSTITAIDKFKVLLIEARQPPYCIALVVRWLYNTNEL